MAEKIQAINTVAKLKQWDKRKAGLQIDYQEEYDLIQRSLATSLLGDPDRYPRKDI